MFLQYYTVSDAFALAFTCALAFLFGGFMFFKNIKEDIRSIRERDPAVKSDLEVFFPLSEL